jgi:ABC-type branched-subunit amino acid transport system ATPase component/ABC-type branched-subunit amino acid transport system permease subunit
VTGARLLIQRWGQVPVLPQGAGWAGLLLVIAVIALFGSDFALYLGGMVIIYAISALGLDWLMGRAGQVSIGNAALMAVGAYTAGMVAGQPWAPFPVPLLIGAVAGGVVGTMVALPALRLSGLYLALATLALQFITSFAGEHYQLTSGLISGIALPAAKLGPVTLEYGQSWFLFLAAILVMVIVGLRNLYAKAPGRAWLAIKESELAAAIVGVNPTRWKVSAFVGSSMLIGLSGGLLAYYLRRASFETFNLDFAILFIVMIIVGGLGSISGTVLGAALIALAPFLLSLLTQQIPPSLQIAGWLNQNIFYIDNGLYGVLVLVFLIYRPDGIMGGLRALVHGFTRTRAAAPKLAPRAVPHQAAAASLLHVRDLRVIYNTGARAVDGLDLDVDNGEIVALLGRNGAGKTSTLRALSGFFLAENVRVTGKVELGGHDILGRSPMRTARDGLILVPERDKVFPNLTVREHLRMTGADSATVGDMLRLFPRLGQRESGQAGLLSGGERQMLALAMAWCARPRLLMIDELSLGLAPNIIKNLIAMVRDYRDRVGTAVLLVEQNATAALQVADRAYVLEAGRVAMAGTAEELSPERLASVTYVAV